MTTVSAAQKNGLQAFLHGDFEKAERVYKQGLAAGAAHTTAVRETGELLHGLGKLYATLAQFDKSEDCYTKAKLQLEEVLGVDHPRVAVTVREMAQLSWQVGRKDQFNALNRRAVELWRGFLVGSTEKLPDDMPSMEALYALRQAKEGIENVHEMAKSHGAEQDLCGIPFAIAAMLELGILYRNSGNYSNAKQFISLALDECAECDVDPLVQSEVVRQLAKTLRLMGIVKESDALYRQVLSTFKQEEVDEHPDLSEIYFELAQNAETRGSLDEAERLYSASLGTTERLLGAQHPQVAYALRKIALLHAKKGLVTAAEVEYKRAIDLLQQAYGHSHRDIAEIWDELGRMYLLQRKYDEAEALYFRAIEIAGSSTGPQPPEVAFYYDRLADVYRHHGRFRKAETAHQRALGIRREAFISTHEEVSSNLIRLAKLYLEWEKFADADAYFRSALTLLKVGHGEYSVQTASCLVNIGKTNRQLAKFKESESALKQAMEILESISSDISCDSALIEPLLCLAQNAVDLGRFKQAKSRYTHAEEILQAIGGETSTQALTLLKLQADLSRKEGYIETAEQLYRKVVELVGENHEKAPIALVESLCELGKFESANGNAAAATDFFDAAMRVASAFPEGDAPVVVNILLAMGDHNMRRRAKSGALSYYKQALQQSERSCGPHHTLFAKCHCAIAEFYSDKEIGQAIEHYLSALQVMETTLGPLHPDLATVLVALGRLWLRFDKPDDAETLWKRAVDIRERVLGSQNNDTLNALALLTSIYMRKGSTTEAKNAGDRIQLIWQENLAINKPTPVDLLCALIRGYSETTRLDEFLVLGEQELELRKTIKTPQRESIPLFFTIAETRLRHRLASVDADTKQRWLEAADATAHGDAEVNGQSCALAATILLERGEKGGALEYQEMAYSAFNRSLGGLSERTVRARRNLIQLCIDVGGEKLTAGAIEAASEILEKALVFPEHLTKENVDALADMLVILGQLYESNKDWKAMMKAYENAVALTSNEAKKSQHQYQLAVACFHQGEAEYENATAELKHCLVLKTQLEGNLSAGLLPALELLAELYRLTNQKTLEANARERINKIQKAM
ncbi:hypothetical protein BH10CYA1_BH10CYA1_50190 [soil metagenome]